MAEHPHDPDAQHHPSPETAPMAPEADRNALVLGHLGLAESIARSKHSYLLEDVDRLSVAYLNLVQAAATYDPEKGESFEAYAAPHIHFRAKRQVRQEGWRAMRMPDSEHILAARFSQGRRQLEAAGTPYSDEALRVQTGMTEEELKAGIQAFYSERPKSYDDVGKEDRMTDAALTTEADRTEQATELRMIVADLDKIPDNDPDVRKVIELYYFQDINQYEIAEVLEIGQKRVHDLMRRGERQLRAMIEKGTQPTALLPNNRPANTENTDTEVADMSEDMGIADASLARGEIDSSQIPIRTTVNEQYDPAAREALRSKVAQLGHIRGVKTDVLQALQLLYLNGKAITTIAEEMGTTPTKVKGLLRSGVRQLNTLFTPEGDLKPLAAKRLLPPIDRITVSVIETERSETDQLASLFVAVAADESLGERGVTALKASLAGTKPAEISEQMGMTEAEVKNLIFRASMVPH